MDQKIDKFPDRLRVVLEDKQRPTLAELSDTLRQTRGNFIGARLQQLIEQRYSDALNLAQSPCPHCGKACRKRREVTKKLHAMQRPCGVKRRWFDCASCGRGVVSPEKLPSFSKAIEHIQTMFGMHSGHIGISRMARCVDALAVRAKCPLAYYLRNTCD